MKEINFAAIIAEKRRAKGITQDELAAYAGVTKASVSKWETGQSFPDITLLPILAAYFDMSIDALMGYSPQMTDKDIEKLYARLASDFATKPFEEVITECESIIKKYYSCYILLLKMALLYLNHASMAVEPARITSVITEAAHLCERVTENCKDKHLLFGAVNLQAMCCLALRDGAKVLALLGDTLQNTATDGALIAQAYQLLGNEEKAQEILQLDLYSNIMSSFRSLMVILQNNLTRLETAEPMYHRAEQLAELFNMKRLNPNNMAMMYLLGAQMYQLNKRPDKALEILAEYTDICINGFFPLILCGDNFFDRIDDALTENATMAVRNDAAVKESMINELQNSLFEPLKNNDEYTQLVDKLKNFIERGK